MAAYGALTALQAALMAGAGGARGLVAAREREKAEQERKKQEMDRLFSQQLGIRSAGARPITGGVPQGFESVGTFRGQEYAAPTQETLAATELANTLKTIRQENELRTTLGQEAFAKRKPEIEAALNQFPKGTVSDAEKALVLSGNLDIGELIKRVDARRQPSPGTQDRLAAQDTRRAAFGSLQALGVLPATAKYNPSRNYDAELKSELNIREKRAGGALSFLNQQGITDSRMIPSVPGAEGVLRRLPNESIEQWEARKARGGQ